tara:strand:- start:12884 stop:13492 length:609 start_codon:yes stop_codon:yes gene_type:complete
MVEDKKQGQVKKEVVGTKDGLEKHMAKGLKDGLPKKEVPKEKTTEKKETPKTEAPKKVAKKVVKKKADRDNATLRSFNVPISSKQSYEICNFIKKRKVEQAKRLLNEVLNMKRAVPNVRYNRDVGHKPGIAAGRYHQKASEHILKLLNAVEANADNLGLDTKNLVIHRISASPGSRPWHGGRQRRRRMKRTNISIEVKELDK